MTDEVIGACVVLLGYSTGTVFWIWLVEIVFGKKR